MPQVISERGGLLMSGRQLSSELLAELMRGNEEVLERLRDYERRLGDTALARKPPDGGWSPGEVFEHLLISGGLYVERLDRVIAEGRKQGKLGDGEWKPSLMGGVLMRAVAPKAAKKRKTIRIFEPREGYREGVIGKVLNLHLRLHKQMEAARGLDLIRVRLSSPASGLVRMNLGDALGILVLHAQRHLTQVDRAL